MPDTIRSAKETLISRGLLRSGSGHPDWLPEQIDRSWRRSISAGATVEPNSLHYVNDFDSDSELYRAARPILDRLEGTLQDLGTSVFLADRTGQIVARRVAGDSERTRFDNACAAEGFDFSEERIGTNGLGTAMQEGGAVFIRGPEHFNEALEQLACAGVGIRHPATGRLVGSLSLAAPADAAEKHMLALVREGAHQIVDSLGRNVGWRELALGRSYQRHRDRGPVIVLNSDTVMSNVTGLSFLNVESHARLWESLMSQDWSEGPRLLDLNLHTLQARALAHRLEDLGDEPAFAVEILNRRRPGEPQKREVDTPTHDEFVTQLHRAATRNTAALSITGPSGSGKLHVALDWLRSIGQPEPIILEAGDLESRPSWRTEAAEALSSQRAVVIRRLEDLPISQLNATKAISARFSSCPDNPIEASPETYARLIMTADLSRCSNTALGVVAQATRGAVLPPLASRSQDIPGITAALLERLDQDEHPILSAATMQVLLRWHWPGNIAELDGLVNNLAREFPGQPVSPYHLPEQMWDAANRHTLTRIECAERSEIVTALRQANGNRSRAAILLGIGRTTLYRKIYALGLEEDALLVSAAQQHLAG